MKCKQHKLFITMSQINKHTIDKVVETNDQTLLNISASKIELAKYFKSEMLKNEFGDLFRNQKDNKIKIENLSNSILNDQKELQNEADIESSNSTRARNSQKRVSFLENTRLLDKEELTDAHVLENSFLKKEINIEGKHLGKLPQLCSIPVHSEPKKEYNSLENVKLFKNKETIENQPKNINLTKLTNRIRIQLRLVDRNITTRIRSAINYKENTAAFEKSLQNGLQNNRRFSRKERNKNQQLCKVEKDILKLEESIGQNVHKISEPKYGRGRYGLHELVEDKKTRDISPKDLVHINAIEHYIIERQAFFNIEHRKIVFKKQRQLYFMFL